MSLLTVGKGFLIGAGMIIPIGAQNAFILNQGIKKNFHFIAATICIVCDLILMSIGIFGGSAIINTNALLYQLITGAGVIFLTVYGALFFKSFLQRGSSKLDKVSSAKSITAVIAATLAVTLLNPHVYLDTVVIIGSISSQFAHSEKITFLIGTALASIAWFYSLAFISAKMSIWLSKDKVQRAVNLSVALIMWAIAISLYLSFK